MGSIQVRILNSQKCKNCFDQIKDKQKIMEKIVKIQDLCVVLELATMDSVTLLFTILNLKKELVSIKVFSKGLSKHAQVQLSLLLPSFKSLTKPLNA